MKISSTNNFDSQLIKIAVYGLSGAGKTTLAKTLKEYRPIVLSAEGGLMSLQGAGIDYIDVTKDDNGNLIPKEQRAERIKQAYLYLLTDDAKKKYSTVILDSLTEIGQCVHDAVKKEFPEAKQALPMWGEYGIRMRDLVKAFRDLPNYHVVLLSLSKVEKDDNGRRFQVFDIAGSISDKLPGFVDGVYYLRANADGIRELVCQPTEAILAKDRSSKLGKVEPANLGLVFNKILEKEKK